jgi:hypothetical protein
MFANLFGTLAFLATLLGLAAAAIGLIFSLVTRRFRTAGRIGLGVLAWMGIYAAVLLAVSFTSAPRVLGPGQEHCFDEMCFSVKNAAATKTVGAGPDQVSAHGVYYIVTVQLRNDAKRVAQKPSDPQLWIQDQQGRRHAEMIGTGDTGLAVGQPVDASQLWGQRLQAGESQAQTIAFDLPAGIIQPVLVITEGGGPTFLIIGDENSPFHARTVFQLAQ